VALAQAAEEAGFGYVWTFDSHVLWQEPFVIYSQILAHTETIKVGPMVTNPLSRDWTVTASLFATLNDMFGNRTVCGIGRGDSAVRVVGGSPASLATLADAMAVIKGLAEGRSVTYRDHSLQIPWVRNGSLDILMAAYGPRALELAGRETDGLILQLGDPYLIEWSVRHATEARSAGERASDPFTVCAAAPAYVGDDLHHQREQVRWFGGMVGNHVADLVARYGARSGAVPQALTDYIANRQQYDYSHHGRAGNPSTDFVPDEVIDRFCVLGPVSAHIERMAELESIGVDQFAVYLMHDAQESTLASYGSEVIPRFSGKTRWRATP